MHAAPSPTAQSAPAASSAGFAPFPAVRPKSVPSSMLPATGRPVPGPMPWPRSFRALPTVAFARPQVGHFGWCPAAPWHGPIQFRRHIVPVGHSVWPLLFHLENKQNLIKNS